MCKSISNLNELTIIPFVDGGRDESGVDCWGCVMLAYKILTGKDLPDFKVGAMNVRKIFAIVNHQDAFGDWVQVDGPSRGVVVVIKNHPEFVNHTGLCIDDKNFIHSMKKMGTVVDRLSSILWKNRIHAYYRYAR